MTGLDLLLTYDADADAAYLYLRSGMLDPVAATVPVEVDGAWLGVNLDLDEDGRLVGIEALDASRRLPTALLEQAADPSDIVRVLLEAMEAQEPDDDAP